jgi:hypothetical protein
VLFVEVRVYWKRTPVSVHHPNRVVLESLILHLRNVHGIRKRSIVMEDREEGGFLFFMYQPCDPRWIITWQDSYQEEE